MQREPRIETYPYIVPLPLGREDRLSFLQAAFGSRVRLDILLAMIDKGVEERCYEKRLIEEIAYSNKTLIKHLDIMVEAGILHQGMERVKRKERYVWMKWFELTEAGRWVALLLGGPEKLPEEQVRETLEESLAMVSNTRIKMTQMYDSPREGRGDRATAEEE